MNNKRIVNALAALILPRLDSLDQKCNRIISELSELKSTLRHSERNIDTLIDKLENSASELLKQAQMYHLELEKNLSEESSLFTLKIVKK